MKTAYYAVACACFVCSYKCIRNIVPINTAYYAVACACLQNLNFEFSGSTFIWRILKSIARGQREKVNLEGQQEEIILRGKQEDVNPKEAKLKAKFKARTGGWRPLGASRRAGRYQGFPDEKAF